MDKLYRNEQWLRNARKVERRSLRDIGEQFGITKEAIRLWCVKFDIPFIPMGTVDEENKARVVVLRL